MQGGNKKEDRRGIRSDTVRILDERLWECSLFCQQYAERSTGRNNGGVCGVWRSTFFSIFTRVPFVRECRVQGRKCGKKMGVGPVRGDLLGRFTR
jgi:hypothetical protein